MRTIMFVFFILFIFSCQNDDNNFNDLPPVFSVDENLMKQGELLLGKEKYHQAIQTIKNSIHHKKTGTDTITYVQSLNHLAEAYLAIDSLAYAQTEIKKALNISSVDSTSFSFVESLRLLSRFETRVNDYDDAMKNVNLGLALLEKIEHPKKEVLQLRFNMLRSDLHFSKSDPIQAYQNSMLNYEKIQKLNLDVEDKPLIVKCFFNIGRDFLYSTPALDKEETFFQVNQYFNDAIDTAKLYSFENHSLVAEAYDGLSLSSHYIKWYVSKYKTPEESAIQQKKSVDYGRKSLAIRKSIFGNNHTSLSASLNAIAIEIPMENAIDTLNLAIKIHKNVYGEKNDKVGLMLNNIGRMFGRAGQFDSCLYYFQESIISLSRNFDDKDFFKNPPLDEVVNEIYLLEILEQKALALGNVFDSTKDRKT